MKGLGHIVPAIVLVCLLASCSGRPRIIPRSVMTDIYADMFLADQWLADHPAERSRVDTMLFYDPILQRHGYTFEDYDASVQHYLRDPEKFSRIFRDAANKLKDGRDRYRRKAEMLAGVRDFNASIKGYKVKDFEEDTLVWRSAFKDSMRRLALLRDSLERDSLYRDSLRLDSLQKDSLVRDSLRMDSLLTTKSFKGLKLRRRIDTNQ